MGFLKKNLSSLFKRYASIEGVTLLIEVVTNVVLVLSTEVFSAGTKR